MRCVRCRGARSGGECDGGGKRGNAAERRRRAVARRRQQARGGGATTAGVVARAGGVFQRGNVAMTSVVATTRQLQMRRRREHGARQRRAWRRDVGSKHVGRPGDSGHGGVGLAARPGRTDERAAEAGGRAAAEEVEMAEAEPRRLHGPTICDSWFSNPHVAQRSSSHATWREKEGKNMKVLMIQEYQNS